MVQVMSRKSQQGFMLLSAVFVLLICTTLGVVLVKGIEQSSANRAVNYWSTQAYLFARSSLELVEEFDTFCQQNGLKGQYEQGLSQMVSSDGRVCDLNYRCDQQTRSAEAAVSCSINQELTVVRIAKKHFIELSSPSAADLKN